ncbi:MAG: hypothetical protein EOP11_01565 [Proteobacteria bacterium]|nr:MAG: hypothetical protein EOP11_01565 [Pseudomonadota bacterium]
MGYSLNKLLAVSGFITLGFATTMANAEARCEQTSAPQPYISGLAPSLIYFGQAQIRYGAYAGTVRGTAGESCSAGYPSVELFIDNQRVSTNGNYNWNTNAFPDGNHRVEVRAYDYQYGYQSNSTYLNIRTDNTDVRGEVFDLAAYLRFNPDVANAFPGDNTRQVQHWLNHGINEGRRAHFFFASQEYLEGYDDLRNAFGNNYSSAIRHYLNNGIGEGRSGVHALRPEVFDAGWYLGSHGDLLNAFGWNSEAAKRHFVEYGLGEGRQASPNFSSPTYLARYGDLRGAFGYNYAAGLRHYIQYGIREGRSGR